MANKDITASITVPAPVAKAWDYLTRPELIKSYLFGTNTETDWSPGSPIVFRGEWEGKAYEDKGTVLEFRPQQRLSYTHWSSFSGLPDLPENYQTVIYEVHPEESGAKITVTSSCIDTQESKDRCLDNWRMVLEGLKKQIEAA